MIQEDKEIDFSKFRNGIKGETFMKDDPKYEQVCNQRWDLSPLNQPLLIVRPNCDQDITETLQFIQSNKLKMTIKCGGHHEDSAIVGGVLIDLELLKDVKVEIDVVRVGGGCLLKDIDRETAKHGMATTLGHIGHVGISGFTIGGGLGHLTKPYGLAIDNLVECSVFLSDGKKYKCDHENNQDLFWCIKGAGKYFGLVSEFVFKLHPVKKVMVGHFTFKCEPSDYQSSIDAMVEVGNRQSLSSIADPLIYAVNINSTHVFIQVIYLLNDDKHHDKHNDDKEHGTKLIEQFKDSTSPLTSSIQMVDWINIQSAFDHIVVAGKYYQEGPLVRCVLTRELSTLLVQQWISHPTKIGSIIITQLGGVSSTPSPTSTSFPFRHSQQNIFYTSVLAPVFPIDAIKSWTTSSVSQLDPYLSGPYINTSYNPNLKQTYDCNYSTLLVRKIQFDPTNLFNQFI